ncbi:hypothetical protein [Oceanobacillus alkalisoli]|nr:hypothetical protein [Oceanobacillus alkalisoli]MCG5104570.1 hypothetical protein [Oceanobacillus alkalisoli]
MQDQQYQGYTLTLLQKIEEAEAIIVGGAAGMSAAAGLNWYEADETFQQYFGEFADKYGIDSTIRRIAASPT